MEGIKKKVTGHILNLLVLFSLTVYAKADEKTAPPDNFRMAFIADAHFHDVYAHFKDHSFEGLHSDITGKDATIRTMQSQLMSTRLFNENYFALFAALDDLVQKGIRYVGLVGDFSDDGQVVHLRKLNGILDSYEKRYGIRFFAIPGNHDPVRPVDNPGGKNDFLGKDGREQKILARERCLKTTDNTGLPAICTDEIVEMGYDGILQEMGQYGFYPQKDYIYWETPYSKYNYDTYSYEKALEESDTGTRSYEICLEGTGGTYRKDHYTHCLTVTDATYLVEPVEGIWILAVDANVYVPVSDATGQSSGNPLNFEGSGNAGYNKMITHKEHVIQWMERIVKEADEKGKTLITFSHFPMVDFYDQAAPALEKLFGKDQLDLKRMPTRETSGKMAKIGVRLNIAGHLHFNDTGTALCDDQFLVNIQVPSLAAYIPGYKILTIRNHDMMEIETVRIRDVPGFNELFGHYIMEHQYLEKNASGKVWNKEILSSANYAEYTAWHLTELTRNRFLPRWPSALQEMLGTMTGKDILIYALLDMDIPISMLDGIRKGKAPQTQSRAWAKAEKKMKKLVNKNHLDPDKFGEWTGFDLAVDFYRLMNADELALWDIDRDRISGYSLIYHELRNNNHKVNVEFNNCFSGLFSCMYLFSNAEPSNNFLIDFRRHKIISLEDNTSRIE